MRSLTELLLNEKQYFINIIDKEIDWLKSKSIHIENLRFAISILFGTIITGSFGTLLISAYQSITFQDYVKFLPIFSTKEVGFASLIFILISSYIYLYNNLVIVFPFMKKIRQLLNIDLNYFNKMSIAEFPKIQEFYKPFIILFSLNIIPSIFVFYCLKNDYSILILLFAFLCLFIVIGQYCITLFKGDKMFREFSRIIPKIHHKEINILSKFIKKINPIFILITISTIFTAAILSLPFLVNLLFSFIMLSQNIHLLESSFLLVLIVGILQFILIYPTRKYFELNIAYELIEKKEDNLMEIRDDIINDTYHNAEDFYEKYQQYLNKFPRIIKT